MTAPIPGTAEVTVVTTCMGRLDFLRRVLPTWIAHTSFPILAVDYSCPQRAGDWIEAQGIFDSRVTVVRAEAKREGTQPVFNLARARNAGASAARGEYLLFLDADCELKAGFEAWMRARLAPLTLLAVRHAPERRFDLGGTLGVHRDLFRKSGGFDENIQGWGTEDSDFKTRLYIEGGRFAFIPEELIGSLPHPDEIRSRYYTEKNIRASDSLNRRYLNRKYVRATGKSFSWWLLQPGLKGRLF